VYRDSLGQDGCLFKKNSKKAKIVVLETHIVMYQDGSFKTRRGSMHLKMDVLKAQKKGVGMHLPSYGPWIK